MKQIRLTRAEYFTLAIAALFLLPAAIPGVGIDYPYFFIMVLVLMAWFAIKWNGVKSISLRSNFMEILLGAMVVISVYAYKIISQSRLGLLDMLFVFSGLVVSFYGFKSFKLFWVPATYGIVLLLGYQLEGFIPNYVALQDWMAGIMASSMQVLGIQATASGHLVNMNSSYGWLTLNVEGDCTGLQGILAFGMLSTMAVLDMKAKMSKLVPLFAVGFVGAFLINILRLIGVFLTFEFLGSALGTMVHVYLGYILFIVWVMIFWALAFRYLIPVGPSNAAAPASTMH